MTMILAVIFYKLGLKNRIFSQLEKHSKEDNFNFFHDISFIHYYFKNRSKKLFIVLLIFKQIAY